MASVQITEKAVQLIASSENSSGFRLRENRMRASWKERLNQMPDNFSYRKNGNSKNIRSLVFERLAHPIKVFGFLMQTKIYLFWKKEGRLGYNENVESIEDKKRRIEDCSRMHIFWFNLS